MENVIPSGSEGSLSSLKDFLSSLSTSEKKQLKEILIAKKSDLLDLIQSYQDVLKRLCDEDVSQCEAAIESLDYEKTTFVSQTRLLIDMVSRPKRGRYFFAYDVLARFIIEKGSNSIKHTVRRIDAILHLLGRSDIKPVTTVTQFNTEPFVVRFQFDTEGDIVSLTSE